MFTKHIIEFNSATSLKIVQGIQHNNTYASILFLKH